MRIFNAQDTRAALPFERLIPALRQRFAQGCVVPTRHVHTLDSPPAATDLESADSGALTSLIMPAWLPGVAYAVKIVNIVPGNSARGLPGLHASVLLHDARTGAPIALIDGDEVTARRTAAASALAAGWLAPTDARHLLLVGAGRVARLLPAAHRVLRPIERVSVWARQPAAAAALAEALRSEGFDAQPTADLAASAGQADIVSCATLARAPVLQGRWLRAGAHLDLIGSFTPAMREVDDDALRGARLYIDTEEALVKSGDLLGPLASGALNATDVQGTLAALCRGEVTGRRTAEERTVFKSVGTALEDLAAAMLVAGLDGPPDAMAACAAANGAGDGDLPPVAPG